MGLLALSMGTATLVFVRLRVALRRNDA